MNLSRWFRRGGHVESRSSYTSTVVDALAAAVSGETAATAAATAAAEYAASVYGLAFASAEADHAALAPEVLERIGRGLILRGESVFAIEVQEDALALVPASAWTITGGARPASWRYELTLPGPSGDVIRQVAGAGVVHVKYASGPQPWRGVGPLQAAKLTATLAANLEQRLGQEAGAKVGYLLPTPLAPDSPALTALKNDLGQLKGGVAMVETNRQGLGAGAQAAPAKDWVLERFGADPPEALVNLRHEAAQAVLMACGVPAEISREAYRQLLHGRIAPLARLVEAELSAKLEEPVSLNFDQLRAADIMSRARAWASLVTAGMEKERATQIAGL